MDKNYARGYRRLGLDGSLTLSGVKYFPRTRSEKSRLFDYVGDGAKVYAVEIPTGVLIVANASDADGHSVVLTGSDPGRGRWAADCL